MEIVRGHFRPEFLNRLDEIILFHRLGVEHMAPIVEIQVGRVRSCSRTARSRSNSPMRRSAGWAGSATIRSMAQGRSSARCSAICRTRWPRRSCLGEVPDGSTVLGVS
jgi:ATP-dependent Clp protease ATP-binding subunit ClpB